MNDAPNPEPERRMMETKAMKSAQKQVKEWLNTQIQKAVLTWMDEKNLGAILFEGEYRFKEAFRRDPELAERFWKKYCLS